MTLLSAKGLTKRFGGLVAVDAVDIDLAAGEIRALIGPNGAGKTTLVGLLCGRIRPDRGSVLFDHQDVTRFPAHRRVACGMGYTFQITSIFGRLSLFDNVALAVQRRRLSDGWPSFDLTADAMAALSRVGLADRAGAEAGRQSYGHQRLLEIAMGLALRPKLLILDEPTQGLADDDIERFIKLMREVAREATILLIEHNMEVVMELADRITVLHLGTVLAEGAPAEIRADAAVRAAYLGS